MNNQVRNIFSTLEGKWQLERTISDGTAMRGSALFKKTASLPFEYHYHEEALFTTSTGTAIPVYRDYIYIYDNETIALFFYEERTKLFYTLHFDSNFTVAQGEHLCKCDLYSVTYHFFDQGHFTIAYKVKGPKKDFSIYTSFKKILR